MSLIREAGFTGSAADTMYGIVMAESGGNSTAYNGNASTGDSSYGLAQINMLGSMGPERRAQFGLSSNDQLFDPLTNLRAAYAISNGGRDFTPWSTYKSGAYQQFAGQSGAQVTSQSAGETPIPAAAAQGAGAATPLTTAQYEQALGTLAGMFRAVPQLRQLLDVAVKEQQPVEDFVNAVQQSSWYRQHSDPYKQYFALSLSSPGEYNLEVQNRRAKVTEMAAQLGVGLVGGEADALAKSSMYNNWSDAQLQAAIGGYYTHNNGGHVNQGGQAAGTLQQINQWSKAYGVPTTQTQLNSWTQAILMGTQTMDGVKQSFINQASSLYPGLRQQLAAGQTTAEVAQPYIAQMSQTLEIPQSQLTVTDPTIQKALQDRTQSAQAAVVGSGATQGSTKTAPGTSGTGEPQLMPLWQFQNQLRQDPRWEQTTNAKQEAYSMLYSLGKSMGFAA